MKDKKYIAVKASEELPKEFEDRKSKHYNAVSDNGEPIVAYYDYQVNTWMLMYSPIPCNVDYWLKEEQPTKGVSAEEFLRTNYPKYIDSVKATYARLGGYYKSNQDIEVVLYNSLGNICKLMEQYAQSKPTTEEKHCGKCVFRTSGCADGYNICKSYMEKPTVDT